MHKDEIRRLIGKVEQKGFTLVPLNLHYKGGRVKAEIALARQGRARQARHRRRRTGNEKGRLMRHRARSQSRRPGAFSQACSQSAIRSSVTFSRPTSEAHQRALPGRTLAHAAQRIRAPRQAHRAGPGITEGEEAQRVDEGIDAGRRCARVNTTENSPLPPAMACPVRVPRRARQRRMQQLRHLRLRRHHCARRRFGRVLRGVAQRQSRAARARRLRRRWRRRPSPCRMWANLSFRCSASSRVVTAPISTSPPPLGNRSARAC